MKKIFNIEIALLVLLSITLSTSLISNVVADDTIPGKRAATKSHYDRYDQMAQESYKETQRQAILITDYILDYAEYSYDVDKKVGIEISDFINAKGTQDLSSINELLSVVPKSANLPITSSTEIANYLTSFYKRNYDVLLSSYESQLNQLMNESLVTEQGDDIFSIAASVGQTMLDTGSDLEKKQNQHKYWTENTNSLKKRKESFPKPPKTPAPSPTAVAHCITMGMEASENPTLATIDEVLEPPEPIMLSDDYFIKQLLFISIPQEEGEEITKNLRKSLSTVLKNMLNTELDKYYKEVKEMDIDNQMTSMIEKTDKVNREQKSIKRDVLDSFEFSSNMTFLKIRHDALTEAFGKLLEVVDQIKELQGIEKGDVQSDAKKMDAV